MCACPPFPAHAGLNRDRGRSRITATREAQSEWGREVEAAARGSLRSTCNSWYVGSNVPGKARVFMPYIGGFPKYVEACTREAAASYAGFETH